jgi:hypothetical protein
MTIARYYDATKNPDGAFFPGVPLRDIEAGEWEALSKRMQESIDAAPFYRKTPVAKAPSKADPSEAKGDSP